jgi:hypothetical protein
VEKPPKQEDKKSSPSSSMELKFELDTRLTVSCVVAVASAYGLLTISIALDSMLLAFGNAVILLLILFVLFENVKRYLINYPYLSDYGQTLFVFLFRRGTEQPHQGDVNNIMPFLIHPKRYAIRTYSPG